MPEDTDLPETLLSPGSDGFELPPAPPEGGGAAPLRPPVSNGHRWQSYQIGEQLATDVGWCFQAVNAGTLEEVLIRITPYSEHTVVRAQAWNELKSLDRKDLIGCVDAIEEGGFRYEISEPAPTTTLKEWAAARQASLEDVQTLVHQIGDVLIALHDRGVVHLNLRTDNIYLPTDETALKVSLGGLEYATLYNQPELIPIPVDPLYAPPEAAGLTKHSPGAGLRAWDWWSLGRILQELVLGRHVLGLMLNRDVGRATAELKTKAEALLLERDPNAPRAGAVELMPPMSQRMTDVMRGLLTSSRDGRWGADEIQRWLKQQPVRDRYQLGRNEQLFGWKDRMFTVPEAAEYFASEESWADGVTNFFELDNPVTLANFVAERPEYRQVRDQMANLKDFMQIPAWSELPLEAKQTAVLAAGWLLLGGDGARLRIFGLRLDAGCIQSLFVRGVAEGVALVKALITRPFIEMISSADPDAARLLTTLEGIVQSVSVTQAISQGWLDLSNPADYARLLLLALEPERKLFETRKGLQERFACSGVEHIQKLFSQPKLTQADMVVLALTAAQPERYGYVTHEEWKNSRYRDLRERSIHVSTTLFWLRLAAATRAGYAVFGPIYLAAAVWLLAGAAAGWRYGYANLYLWMGGAFGLFLLFRLVGSVSTDVLVHRHAPGAKPWTLFTSSKRCSQELLATAKSGVPVPSGQALRNELARVRSEVAKLGMQPPPPPLPSPGFAAPAWSTSLGAWMMLVVGIALGQSSWTEQVQKEAVDSRTAAARAIEDALKPKPGEQPTAEDYFFDNARNPRVPWNVAKPDTAAKPAIAGVKPATSDDVAQALIDGQRILMSYQRGSVDTLIAVPVHGKNGAGLMLYDGKNRRVIERKVLIPATPPKEKSWLEVESLKVYYPGTPAPAANHMKRAPAKRSLEDMPDLPEREIHRGPYHEASAGADEMPTKAQPLPEALNTMLP